MDPPNAMVLTVAVAVMLFVALFAGGVAFFGLKKTVFCWLVALAAVVAITAFRHFVMT